MGKVRVRVRVRVRAGGGWRMEEVHGGGGRGGDDGGNMGGWERSTALRPLERI